MESKGFSPTFEKFNSVEEELAYLREYVARREAEIESSQIDKKAEQVVLEQVKQYAAVEPHEVLHESFVMSPADRERIVLDLEPETHDGTMNELYDLVRDKGILNALKVVEAMKNPHIDDDFHRFLVAYVLGGLPLKDLSRENPLWKALTHTLYELVLPTVSKDGHKKTLKETLSMMEQFYAGMLSISDSYDKGNVFTIELANPQNNEEFIFYASVPASRQDLFEKQILSVYPDIKLHIQKNDYNVFLEQGCTATALLKLEENSALPIKMYDKFEYDPINVLLSTLSKLQGVGEGASVQLVFAPAESMYLKAYTKALSDLEKGASRKKAFDFHFSFTGQLGKEVRDIFQSLATTKTKKDSEEKKVDQTLIEQVRRKIATPIIKANIRIVVSAQTQQRASAILSDIESAFNQFTETTGNRFGFIHPHSNEEHKILHDFSYRLFRDKDIIPLSIQELATVMHIPNEGEHVAPSLKVVGSASAPAPLELPTQGIVIGKNVFRGKTTKICMNSEDRLRHTYVIGQTGTGKTTLLKNMIIQDIHNGEGVCMIDPHGSDIQDVLANIPPHRYEDVIYFDPSYTDRPMALNMLEYDVRYPEQKTFVVNEMLAIFNKLFDMKTAGGPMFEQYFRNATMLVIEDPETGNTLLDVARVMSNKEFRQLKLSRCKNPIVSQFWREIAEKAGGEASLQNIVPYVTSKFDVFLSNDIMRPIIAQEVSSINFRQIMDEKKILLVNLAKGRLGDINSSLIGLIVVGKILMAALSRVDSMSQNLPPFYLYIDEFQNITTNSIATILSEARKYKLSLTIAHQFIAQLEPTIKDAVFGNVGSMAVFRVGSEDAEFLKKQFEPTFSASDIMNLDNHHAYLKMLANGRPLKPFNIERSDWPPKGDQQKLDALKQLSYLKYGKKRETVEAAIMSKYAKSHDTPKSN